MKKVINGSILAAVCFLLLFFAPGTTSLVFVAAMTLLCAFGYGVGICRINGFAEGFSSAIARIQEMKKITVAENWLYVKQMDSLFRNRYLDGLLARYAKKVEQAKQNPGAILPDIESSISEDHLALRCQKNFLAIIPGTLTGLGILGTFYGLIRGLGGIHFSSVDVVVDSITSLVSGIDTAFYTSIAGVGLSLVFEILTKLSWNDALSILFDFYDCFHSRVIPPEQEQRDLARQEFCRRVSEFMEQHTHEKTAD